MTMRPRRSRLLVVDGPGGPFLEWYVPRLAASYDLHVLWIPSGDDVQDDARREVFSAHCTHSTLPTYDNAHVGIVSFARDWRPDGIVGFSELVVTAVHTAALELGLPSNSEQSLTALQDKHAQRQAMAKAGVPVPRFARVSSASDLHQAVAEVRTPSILKPAAGVGSMATYRVTEGTDLSALWDAASADYLGDPRGSGSPDFVLEELLIGEAWHDDDRYGPYASVESVVADGIVHNLSVTDKFTLTEPFRENGGIMPSMLPDDVSALVLGTASQAIRAMGITNSAVHTEIMFTADGPRVIEVNSRIGGGVTEMLHHCYGYDVVDAMAAVATGAPVPELGPLRRYSAFHCPQAPAADVVLASVPSLEDLRAWESVEDVQMTYRVGDRPQWERGTKGGTLVRIVASASTAEELLDLAEYLASDKAFTFAPGNTNAEA